MSADITTKTFIDTIFPPDQLGSDETVVLSYPDSFTDRQGREVSYYKQLRGNAANIARAETEPRGWLYCVSTVTVPPRGEKLRRRLQDLCWAYVLVLDDIGTKAAVPPVAPGYIMETSPNNYQYGYFLEPVDVSDPQMAAHFDACLVGLARAGYNDGGCRSASRVVKLPGAIHKSGFVTRLVEWNPSMDEPFHWDQWWALDELMLAMGVEPARRRVVHAPDPNFVGVTLDDVLDPVLDWLNERGHTTGIYNDQWVHLFCPWQASHGNAGEDPGSATSYSPFNYGLPGRAFHCRHEHCSERRMVDFLGWVIDQGGPDVTSPVAPTLPEALNKVFNR
jgi:hypothetical protein